MRKTQACYTCLSFSLFFYHYHYLTLSKKRPCVLQSAVTNFAKKRPSPQQELEKKRQLSAQICFYECEEHNVTWNNSALVSSSMSTPARSTFVTLPNMAVICWMSALTARTDSFTLPHKQKVNETKQCQCVYVCIYFQSEKNS